MKKTAIVLVLVICMLLPTVLFASCEEKIDVEPIDDNYRVFYQIFVGSFSDSNNDGIGDLRGIINRMDYLNDGNVNSTKSLGVQGIWLSPIFESPSYHKYDATDYYNIDPKFGTKQDLRELLNLCHERNVKVILDLAINHTAKVNHWFNNFVNARKLGQTENEYYDFYTCVESENRLAGHTYYPVPGCGGMYYEGNFDSGMPELNFDNPAVRQEVLNVAKHYLEMGVDGFRFDAIKYIYFNDTPKSAEFWQWYMDELRKIKPDIYCVGECWSGDSEILQYYGALNCFSFSSAEERGKIAGAAKYGSISSFARSVESFQKNILQKNKDAMYIPFISNHDMDRAAGYLPLDELVEGDNGVMATSKTAYIAANIYLLCSGSPFIYYGEEIAMKGTRGGAQTDANRRLAMLWGDNDTVKDPTGATFKADAQINGTVKSQRNDRNSLWNHYRKLIKMRNKYPQIARGSYTAVIAANNCAGFVIEYNGEKTLLLHNVSTGEVTIDLTNLGNYTTLCDYIGIGKAGIQGNTLTIKGQTSVIIK